MQFAKDFLSDTGPLGFWPGALPDEPLFSILARWQVMLGLPDATHILKLAFNEASVHSHLPNGLGYLAKKIGGPVAETAEELLRNHTAMPYLSRFFWASEFHKAGAAMRSPKKLNYFLGDQLLLEGHGRRKLAFCPECVLGDIRETGQPGWRRVQQMPCVYVCPTHGQPLRFVPSRVGHLVKLTACPMNPEAGELPDLPFHPLDALSLARGSAWLMANPAHPDVSLRHLTKLFDLLARRGYDEAGNGRFCREFGERFNKRSRHLLGWRGTHKTPSGPEEVLRAKSHPLHCEPIRFLATLAFLDVTPESFFAAGLPE